MSQLPSKRGHTEDGPEAEEMEDNPPKIARTENSENDQRASSSSGSSSASSDDEDNSSDSHSMSSDNDNSENEEESTNNVEFSTNLASPKDEEAAGDETCPFRSLRNFASKESDDEQLFSLGDFLTPNSGTGPVDPVFIDEDSSGHAAAAHVDLDDQSNDPMDENSSFQTSNFGKKQTPDFGAPISRRSFSELSDSPPPLPSACDDPVPPPPPGKPPSPKDQPPPPPTGDDDLQPDLTNETNSRGDEEDEDGMIQTEENEEPEEQEGDLSVKTGKGNLNNAAESSEEEEEEEGEYFSSSEVESMDENEIFQMLDENVKSTNENSVEEPPLVQYENIRYSLIEKNRSPFDVLPIGWICLTHHSGIPIYLHKATKVVTLTRPYHLGKMPYRNHRIPINAIPCLNYRLALDKERQLEENKSAEITSTAENNESSLTTTDHDENNKPNLITQVKESTAEPTQPSICPEGHKGQSFPEAKIQEAKESQKRALLKPIEVREYCEKLFQFNAVPFKRFKSWPDYRRNCRSEQSKVMKELKRASKSDNRATLPEGTKIITIPVVEMAPPTDENPQVNALNQQIIRKSKKEWYLNPAGKSAVCILHEYLQHSMRQAPVYKYSEVESASTPYCATIEINSVEYGKGFGTSKKIAKSEAARLTLELLIPEFKKVVTKNGTIVNNDNGESFFDNIRIEDPRVPHYCNLMSEPSPYAILVTCLQKNYGLGDTSIQTSLTPARNHQNEFKMKISKREVSVFCKNKRDGKQMASQKLLQLLHPNLKSWGSLVRMYGSRAITAQKSKKEKESEVTVLQSRTLSQPSPSKAILDKLRSEMRLLHARKKQAEAPVGKLTLPTVYKENRNDCLEKIDL